MNQFVVTDAVRTQRNTPAQSRWFMVLTLMVVLTAVAQYAGRLPVALDVADTHIPPSPLPATPLAPPFDLPAELQGKPELVPQRTAYTRSFDMGGGQYAVMQDQYPINYRDRDGNWQPVNPAFAASADGWANVANSLHTSVAGHLSSANVTGDDVGVGWQPQSLVLQSKDDRVTIATVLPEHSAPAGVRSADGRTIRYGGSWNDRQLQDQWQSDPGSSEYSLRLARLPHIGATIPASLDLDVQLHLRPGTTIKIDGQPAQLPVQTTGTITFVGSKGEQLLLAPPSTYEQADQEQRVGGSYRLRATDDPTIISLSVSTPWAWLSARERHFPVIVDPLFQIKSPTEARDAFYNPDGSFNQVYDPRPLEVGQFNNGVQRLLFRFGMPSLPPGANITKSFLAVTPTAMNFTNRDYLVANVVGYQLANNAWMSGNTAPSWNGTPVLAPQAMRYNRGEQNHPGVFWDVTSLAQGWQAGFFSSNNGLMLTTQNEFCEPDPNGCGGFRFDFPSSWTTEEYQASEANSTQAKPSISANTHGGLRLLVYYIGPSLTENTPIDAQQITFAGGPPNGNDPYYHADHEYLVPAVPSHWQALVTRGIGDSFGACPPTTFPVPCGVNLKGSLPLKLRSGDDTSELTEVLPPQATVGTILLNGHSGVGVGENYRLRVGPTGGVQPNGYDVRLLGEQDNLATGIDSSNTKNYYFNTGDPMALYNVQLPQGSNSRVDVHVCSDNEYGAYNIFDYARGLHANLLDGSSAAVLTESGPGVTRLGSNAPATGHLTRGCATNDTGILLSSGIFTPHADNYGLELAYDGPQLDIWTCVSNCGKEFPQYDARRMTYYYGVRITACDAASQSFPTAAGTCQVVKCPNSAFPPANYREVNGSIALWSASGWTSGSSPATTVDGVAPMYGDTAGTSGKIAPLAAVIGGTITYNGGNVTMSSSSSTILVQCGPPSNANNPLTSYFSVFDGPMQYQQIALRPDDYFPAVIPNGNVSSHIDPWSKSDRSGGDLSNEQLWVDVSQYVSNGVGGNVSLRRQTGVDLSFDAFWTLDVNGWPSLSSGVSRLDSQTPPDVASLLLGLGSTFSLDTPAASGKDKTRQFAALRAAKSTVTQPVKFGGASKPVQSLILPRGAPAPSDPPQVCTGSCIDLRATDDTPTAPDRIWAMPDIHTNAAAGTVMFSTAGDMQVWSKDHPAAQRSGVTPQDTSAQYSFDSFGASVSVEQAKCDPGDATDSTVIRGETRMTLPNMGDGSNPDSVVAASFKLCNTSLRTVAMSFHSSLGIPIGNSGLFLTGLSGEVDLYPDYTQIKFGLDFQASQGGDGGLLYGHGDVTIDTRGLFAFQGTAKILGVVDADGRLWAAWNPIDVGFEFDLHYKDWFKGFARAHVWQGQGWQHKYSWLPDNNEKHLAAEIGATITIKKGAAFSWWFIDIPPSNIDFGIDVAFGQFCTNSNCSTYEWGIKGKFTIAGYDVGLYYGFDHGFDFILGDDNHILIDQYGGGPVGPIAPTDNPALGDVHVLGPPPAVNGTTLIPVTVSGKAENILFALGWQAGNPSLTLIRPDGKEITAANAGTYGATFLTDAHSTLIGVQNPMAGNWQAKIGNLSKGEIEHYKFLHFANHGAPGTPANPGSFTAPVNNNDAGTGSYTIKWNVPVGTPSTATIMLRYSKLRGIPDPPPPTGIDNLDADVPIVANYQFSKGSYTWNTSGLASGAYYIDARVDDGVNALADGTISDPDNTCLPRSEFPSSRAFDPNRFPGTSAFTATGSIQINDTTAPGTPSGVNLTGVDGAILARWNPSPEPDLATYLVRWYAPLAGINPPTYAIINKELVTATAMPTLRIGGLTNGINYGVDVAAVDASGNVGTATPLQYAKPDGTTAPVPLAPINLHKTAGTSTSASFAWTTGAGPAPAGYRVFWSKLGTLPANGQVDSTTPSVTLSNLQTGATYLVRVSALDSGGWQSASSDPVQVVITNGVDADKDGLPDDWEHAFGVMGSGNPAPAADGLTNLQKYQYGLNPTLQDSDGDGFSDAEELAAGTDPLDARSHPTAYAQPRVKLDTDRLLFSYKLGDPAPAPQNVGYSNVGGGTLSLAASSASPWITAHVVSGNIGNVVQVNVDPTKLNAGYYSGVVRLVGRQGEPIIGPPACIRVQAWISPPDNVLGPSLFLPLIRR